MPTQQHSHLFIPADRPDLVAKAQRSQADVIILDLEDAVAANAKHTALMGINALISELHDAQIPVWVRVNNEPSLLNQELAHLDLHKVDALMLPKTQSPTQLIEVSALLGEYEQQHQLENNQIRLVALMETALGLCNAQVIAAADPRISTLAFGSEDYCASIGCEPTKESLTVPCQILLMAAKAHHLKALGFAGSITNFQDLELLRAQLNHALTIGFDGALAIHPKQVQAINACFDTQEHKTLWARKVVSAFNNEPTRGVVVVDGQMVDKPVYERAQQILNTQHIEK